jgi:hypothetical protein
MHLGDAICVRVADATQRSDFGFDVVFDPDNPGDCVVE